MLSQKIREQDIAKKQGFFAEVVFFRAVFICRSESVKTLPRRGRVRKSYLLKFSIQETMADCGFNPTLVSTCLPSLNRNMVGILRIP